MLELENAQQFRLGKRVIAHEIDVADTRAFALFNLDLDVHSVSGQILDFSINGRPITTLGNVLTFQFQAHSFQGRLFEDFAFLQTLIGKALQQSVGFDGFVAV